ncbi:hypothetical protein LOK49_LG04G00612 [Camellia lanceoleosa]|uniref:Uncharacterized protein n=1 Tax=Camellia lanceoleosa TaxID=1840588 RepID=A0ACC0I1W6_9ERIC|nr:hypothetical protein LOK49_LG04G00612 [Camellia lanceoleosa]
MASGNSPCRKEALECQDMLENIAHVLLSDTQFTTASDEMTLVSRVNSLRCLLQDPDTAPNMQVDCENQFQGLDDQKHIQASESMNENTAPPPLWISTRFLSVWSPFAPATLTLSPTIEALSSQSDGEAPALRSHKSKYKILKEGRDESNS